jgi:hypothetical protein
MGGSSKSSTKTPTYTPQTYASPNSSILTGLDVNRNSSVTVTDGGAFDLAGQLVEGTVNASNSAREDALMFAGESLVSQREAMADTINAGYSFAGEAANRAFDGMERSQELGYKFAGEATQAGYNFAGEATNRSMDLIDSDRDDTFSFLGEAFSAAMASAGDSSDRVQELASQGSTNLMENAQYAMDQVQEANKSENIEAIRMIVLAGVATVGFIAWSNSK